LSSLLVTGRDQTIRRQIFARNLIACCARVKDKASTEFTSLESVRAKTADMLKTIVLVGDLRDCSLLDILQVF
jgi:hypothetical protein